MASAVPGAATPGRASYSATPDAIAPPAQGQRSRASRAISSRPAWILLAVLAAVLLSIGSVHPPATTDAARIAHLDAMIKCPSCEDLSLSQSNAPSALTLRHQVAAWVEAGWSDQRVENWVVSHDGPGGLLVPQASGISIALYAVPAVLVAGAALCVGWALWRRRRVRVGFDVDGG